MMAMANDTPTPNWRNFAAWGAAGAVFYVVATWGGSSILTGDGMAAILRALRSKPAAAGLALGLLLAMAVVGFTNRKRPVSLRNARNFLIRDAAVLIVLLLAMWGVTASARAGILGAMHVSEWAAAMLGAFLVGFAVLGSLVTASAQTDFHLIDDEVAADEMRERGRLFLCSFAWIAACGLLLIVLSLAQPGGLLSPAAALAGALILIFILVMLGIVSWRLSDELGRTLSREAGHMAYYLIIAIGGGWTILAHLGFVAGPAPIDWLTLFTVLIFAGVIIAVGRRKLLIR
jgi:hypothetical protein